MNVSGCAGFSAPCWHNKTLTSVSGQAVSCAGPWLAWTSASGWESSFASHTREFPGPADAWRSSKNECIFKSVWACLGSWNVSLFFRVPRSSTDTQSRTGRGHLSLWQQLIPGTSAAGDPDRPRPVACVRTSVACPIPKSHPLVQEPAGQVLPCHTSHAGGRAEWAELGVPLPAGKATGHYFCTHSNSQMSHEGRGCPPPQGNPQAPGVSRVLDSALPIATSPVRRRCCGFFPSNVLGSCSSREKCFFSTWLSVAAPLKGSRLQSPQKGVGNRNPHQPNEDWRLETLGRLELRAGSSAGSSTSCS